MLPHPRDRCSIYALECQHQKYYIGRSTEPSRRILQHFQDQGSGWTRLHPPIRVLTVYENCTRFDEDKYTKEYMDKFGIENVRGGSYCQVELSDDQYQSLIRELRNASDKCTRCGRSGHFVRDCYARTSVAWQPSGGKRSAADMSNESQKRSRPKAPPPLPPPPSLPPPPPQPVVYLRTQCFRCGGLGHWARDCPAQDQRWQQGEGGRPGHGAKECTRAFPDDEEDEEDEPENVSLCNRCGRHGHWARDCNMFPEEAEEEEDDGNGTYDCCARCGRNSHWADTCFARTTRDGLPL